MVIAHYTSISSTYVLRKIPISTFFTTYTRLSYSGMILFFAKLCSMYKHPHKGEGNKRTTYASYLPRGGIVQNITQSDKRHCSVERQTNGHSSDSSNMEFMNKISVVCVKKMMKNRRSYSAATCVFCILLQAQATLFVNCGVCWYATKQPS